MIEPSSFDVIVVGAGPAGIAAALEAGPSVAVLDDNPSPGGQIWRGVTHPCIDRLKASPIAHFPGTQVIAAPEQGLLIAECRGQASHFRYSKLIIATGARERFLPFPGWTLPNVMGAGGLQAMVKGGLPIKDRRVVVAGSGPLLLAVAAYLRKKRAVVSLIAEQAPFARLAAFLASSPGKLSQAAQLKWTLRGIPYRTSCWPVAAEGDGKLTAAVLNSGEKIPCDYLACGFGLVPNLELPLLLGCEIANGFVGVNQWQQTSVRNIYCAGEPTGIGGLDLALISGRIAGLAAAGRQDQARNFFPARDRALRFKASLARAFSLRDELKSIATPATLICRCEDVPLSSLQQHPNWRSAKLHTRCGMGPCQGRICGPALEFLQGWEASSTRPPLFPAPLKIIAFD